MSRKKEGVAPAKETTPVGKWLQATKPIPSLADQEERGRLTTRQAIGSAVFGLLFLLSFMWLAAAY